MEGQASRRHVRNKQALKPDSWGTGKQAGGEKPDIGSGNRNQGDQEVRGSDGIKLRAFAPLAHHEVRTRFRTKTELMKAPGRRPNMVPVK